jgi:hypothetical protein
MPQDDLTPEQKQKIENWFRDKRHPAGAICPICQTRSWTILPQLVTPLVYAEGGLLLGGASYPHFVLVCNNCGNSQFINAVITGLVEPKKPEGSTT